MGIAPKLVEGGTFWLKGICGPLYCLEGNAIGPANSLMHLTLFVTSILAVAGVMSGVAFGAVAVSAGGVSFLAHCKDKSDDLYDAITVGIMSNALPIIFGALAISGTLSSFTAGWVVLGTTLGVLGYGSYYASCVLAARRMQETQNQLVSGRLPIGGGDDFDTLDG
jgi:hypothetical protein